MSTAIEKVKTQSLSHHLRVAGLIAISLGIVAAAERDLQRRPAAQVRGSKLLWRVLSLNALGSLSYFRWGRQQTTED